MSAGHEKNIWIYTDADNTLWDTNAVFSDAQLHLLEHAEQIAGVGAPSSDRLSYLRQVDQDIAKTHHAHLRYPPILLLRALTMTLRGTPRNTAVTQVSSQGATPTAQEEVALAAFRKDLEVAPSLLPGVADGLKLAKQKGIPVYLVTEGPGMTANARLKDLGIEGYVEGVLSATKSTELYSRLIERAAPRVATMIGDQPDRDVRLAHGAGMKAILVRGQFLPHWVSKDDDGDADAVVPDFLAGVRWAIDQSTLQPHPIIS